MLTIIIHILSVFQVFVNGDNDEGMAISTKPRLLLPLRRRCEVLDDYRRKRSNVKGKIASVAYLWKCAMCSSVNNRNTVARNNICTTFCARSAYFYIRLEFRIIDINITENLFKLTLIISRIARKRGRKKGRKRDARKE